MGLQRRTIAEASLEINRRRGGRAQWALAAVLGSEAYRGHFVHQQFALDEQQWQTKGKGKSADGDRSTRAISFRSSDYGTYGTEYTYAFRAASVITFPALMESLGEDHNAAELWGFYKSLPLLVLRRQHSWGSPLLREAAKWRYREYGQYGHRR